MTSDGYEEWTSTKRYSTEKGFEYSIRERQTRYERSDPPCTLVVATHYKADQITEMGIPCFHCSREMFSDMDNYLRQYQDWFAFKIRWGSTRLCLDFAKEVSKHIKSTLEYANANHGHSCLELKPFTNVYFVDVSLHNAEFDESESEYNDGDEDEDADMGLFNVSESEYDEDLEMDVDDQEYDYYRPTPATNESVQDLLSKKAEVKSREGDQFEIGWSRDQCCMICLDEIHMRESSLAMDCSHVFHQHCLVSWLHTSHLCPLCRRSMPTKLAT